MTEGVVGIAGRIDNGESSVADDNRCRGAT